jgi:hypothetical protein
MSGERVSMKILIFVRTAITGLLKNDFEKVRESVESCVLGTVRVFVRSQKGKWGNEKEWVKTVCENLEILNGLEDTEFLKIVHKGVVELTELVGVGSKEVRTVVGVILQRTLTMKTAA